MSDKLTVEVSKDGAKVSAEGSGAERLGHAIADALSPFTEGLGLLGDQVRVYRQQRLEAAAAHVKKLTSGLDGEITKLPPKQIVTWIEEASLAESDELSQIWAKLLVGAATNPSSINQRFMELLSKLSKIEVQFLDVLFDRVTTERFASADGKISYYGRQLAEEEISSNWDMDIGQSLVAVSRMPMPKHSIDGLLGDGWFDENYRSLLLLRDLGLMDFKAQLDDEEFLTVYLTPLGDEFVEACQGPIRLNDYQRKNETE